MDTSELRRLADTAGVLDNPVSNSLRKAADEIDRLRRDTYRIAGEAAIHNAQLAAERDEARAECAELQQGVENLNALSTVAMGEIAWLRAIVSLVRSLLSEDGVKDSLAHLSVFHVLLERLG